MVIVEEILEARRTDGVQRLPGGRQRVAGVLCTRGTLEKFDKNPKPAISVIKAKLREDAAYALS